MGIYLNYSQYRITTAILFIISITFCSAMIGLVATYWLQRYNTCNDLNLTNCNQKTHDYLFDGYRNITNKFFVDCFTLIINLISIGIVSVAYQKVPKAVQHILVLILLALSVWSLACTIQSIDQEDKLDQTVVQQKSSIQIQLLTGEAAVASANASLNMYKNFKNTLPSQATQALAQVTSAITQLQSAISTGQAKFPIALFAYDSLQKLHNKYQNYRNSCMALVLINFASIFLIFMFNVFSFPSDSKRVENAKLEQVVTTNGGLENVAFKKAPSSNIEMNAQNVM
ncbi:hypothetical protein ABPG72_021768 [Tetrahymena utriculariae]